MKKIFLLDDLDCAHCAVKIEEAVAKINGVKTASVNFLKSNLTVEADENDFDDIMKKAGKLIQKIEPECTLREI